MTGERVGSYEIVRVLARGGMAVVYLAHQPALDRDVALKQLDLEVEDVTLAQRFVREARMAGGLDHPNVVTLFDFFEHGSVPYIAMEYVSGGSLRPLVGDLRLPQVFGVLEGVLNGLSHAEERSIAHRDLKPENVLVTGRGGVKIADFGIARAYNAALTGHLTSTNTAIGTPAYMAPEQALSEPLGPYTDIYAVGVMAYEMLAGRPPFGPGSTPMAVLYAHVHHQPPPLADLAPETPASLLRWVERMLAKAPADRPASAAEAWEALEEIAVAELGPYWRRSAAVIPARPEQVTTALTTEEPTTPLPATTHALPPAAVTRSRRPRRLALLAGGACVLGVAVVAAFVLPESGRAPPPPRAAVPFDFDGDRRQELVVGMPESAEQRKDGPGGLVVIHRGDRDATPTVITPQDAGLPAPYERDDEFGSSPQSGDFDRDGRADLAVGVPGRELVTVLYGSADGLGSDRRQTFGDRGLPGGGRYGHRLVAGDFDDDGIADLAVGAPGEDFTASGSGAIELLFGSPDGLTTEGSHTIERPDDDYAGFGRRLRTGDVNGDDHLDLVEGAPDRPDGTPGHITFCRGGEDGPTRCRPLDDSGTSSVAVADVTGDGIEDIVQGDHLEIPPGGGEIRLWRGGRRGPADQPQTITQEPDEIPGNDVVGDSFGFSVDAGDLDADGYADMLVGAPGENAGAGTMVVIRGGRAGYALTGSTRFHRASTGVPGDPVPDENLGWSLAIVRLPEDERPDLMVSARGARRLDDAILLMEAGPGAFAADETSVSRLRLGDAVQEPQIDAIRIARGGAG